MSCLSPELNSRSHTGSPTSTDKDNMWQDRNEKHDCFYDLVNECRHAAPEAELSHNLRMRLENFSPRIRREITVYFVDATPLFYACRQGQTKIVEYLITVCRADIEQRGIYEESDHSFISYVTPLCCATISGKLSVIQVLLHHGADVNAVTNGMTALHYAILKDMLEATQLLIDHGADYNVKSKDGDDALQMACLEGASSIFDYLTNTIRYSRNRLANAHELMGSTLLEKHNNLDGVLSHWQKAIVLRKDDPALLPKTPIMPIRASYQYQSEFSSTEELDNVMTNIHAIRIQSLLIAERILGPYRKETITRIVKRGASYCDLLHIQRFIEFWRRIREIQVESDSNLDLNACCSAELVVNLLINNHESQKYSNEVIEPQYSYEQRFNDSVAILKLLSEAIAEPEAMMKFVRERPLDSFDNILKCITHLIYLMLQTAKSNRDKILAKALVTKLICINPQTVIEENTLLHLCVSNSNILLNTQWVNHPGPVIIIFPQLEVIQYLLDCGANVNATNATKSTPLHFATNSTPLHFAAIDSDNYNSLLVKLLLDNGAHIDQSNLFGQYPSETIANNTLNNDICILNYITLQCLCATVIKNYNITYDRLPKILEHFIQLH